MEARRRVNIQLIYIMYDNQHRADRASKTLISLRFLPQRIVYRRRASPIARHQEARSAFLCPKTAIAMPPANRSVVQRP